MRLEHYSLEKLKAEITNLVGRHLDLNTHQLFFFGSRVLGKGDERSDIDVGVKGPAPVSLSVLAEIEEELADLPILYKIDFVDFNQVSGDFRQVVGKNIEPIYTVTHV